MNRPIQKSQLFKMYDRAKEWWILWVTLPYMVLSLGCSPALPEKIEFPTASEAAIAAVNLTDAALAASLAARAPSKVELALVWEPRVDKLDQVREAVKTGKDLCKLLPELRTIGVAVGCDECVRVTKAAEAQCL